MRSYQATNHDDFALKRHSRAPRVLLACLILILSPLLYEGGIILVSSWQSMMGVYWEPHTPIIDMMVDLSRTISQYVQSRLSGTLMNGSLTPVTAVPIAVGWAVLMAVLFLRKDR
jgi:ABC-type phosphate transport system permease subunit